MGKSLMKQNGRWCQCWQCIDFDDDTISCQTMYKSIDTTISCDTEYIGYFSNSLLNMTNNLCRKIMTRWWGKVDTSTTHKLFLHTQYGSRCNCLTWIEYFNRIIDADYSYCHFYPICHLCSLDLEFI